MVEPLRLTVSAPLLSQCVGTLGAAKGRVSGDDRAGSKALAMLRQELAQAQDEGEGHQFRFEITEAEVEFLVEVDAEGGAEAGEISGWSRSGQPEKSRGPTHIGYGSNFTSRTPPPAAGTWKFTAIRPATGISDGPAAARRCPRRDGRG